MGIGHFFIVDNDSDDGSTQFLASQPDVTLYQTNGSYKKARFGVDWLNHLQSKHGDGHWCLTVDPDEFFIYPFCDTRPLRALTDWLDASHIRSFGAMLLDMYPKGKLSSVPYAAGQNPMTIANWFDAGNYTFKRNPRMRNIWIQGGPRARVFFKDDPKNAPALNKIPLVKWNKSYVFMSSTHNLLPRGLNTVYDRKGGEMASGMLLHAKFLTTFADKAREEVSRNQHYENGQEYKVYAETMAQDPDLWCRWSEKYINWRQLEVLGLMSKGNWT